MLPLELEAGELVALQRMLLKRFPPRDSAVLLRLPVPRWAVTGRLLARHVRRAYGVWLNPAPGRAFDVWYSPCGEGRPWTRESVCVGTVEAVSRGGLTMAVWPHIMFGSAAQVRRGPLGYMGHLGYVEMDAKFAGTWARMVDGCSEFTAPPGYLEEAMRLHLPAVPVLA